MPDQHSRRWAISNLAYADDLAAMTNSIADMKVQAQKVQAFVAWSGMTVNCKNVPSLACYTGKFIGIVAAVYYLKA